MPATTKSKKIIEDKLKVFLKNIKEKNPSINAFTNIYEDEALKKIDYITKKGPLAGLVVGLKELFCYKSHPISACSKILEGFVSQITATCVEKLLDTGSIIIGHQNCDEFAMGSSNENSYLGPVKNPVNLKKVAGGSSGGSAAAVAANMCDISLGTDTGGSVRQPAAFCGIIGLKPTYSRISRYGVIAYASSFDTVGIFSKNIESCASVLNVISGNDEKDNTSYSGVVPDYTQFQRLSKLKIAYFKEIHQHSSLQKDIKISLDNTIEFLKSKNHSVEEISFPYLKYCLPLYYILTTAEASANLARYDGIRYGYRSKNAENLEEIYMMSRSEGFGDEVKRRILLGTAVLSEGYHDSYYGKAQKVRKMIKDKYDNIFKDYDFIIMPTTPTTAFDLGSITDPIQMYLSDLFTVPASVAGIPAISIPIGRDKENLPIGLQILANKFEEQKLLSFSKDILDSYS